MNREMERMRQIGKMITQNAFVIRMLGRLSAMHAAPDPKERVIKARKDQTGNTAGKAPEKKEKEKETQISRELKILMDPSRYSASDIPADDLRYIIGHYGSDVENIYHLGAGQLWMLEEVKRVKSAFFLQILTKAVIQFDLPVFRQQADEVCRKHENLRSAFVCKGTGSPWRVILKDRHPEINCFDLSDLEMEEFDAKIPTLMEADRHRGFDLERDALLRINIYKSCEKDTYAIVISQPHINSDGMSLGILIRDLFFGYVLDMNGIDKKVESQSFRSYAKYLDQVDTDREIAFWKKKLKDIDEDQLLPGQQVSDLDYESVSLFVPFDDRELEVLQDAQRTFKVTRFTILQGLWGIMTAKLKERSRIVFGAITSGREAGVSDSMALAGGFVNAVPVEISFDENELLADFFQKVQNDFLQCMNNSHLSPGQIQEALGRKNPVFSHLLNNHNFAAPAGSGFRKGGISGIKIIGGDVYDNLSEDLCVYFTTIGEKQGCNYSYNARAFSKKVIQLISEYYKSYLTSLMDHGKEGRISMLPELDTGLIPVAQDARSMVKVKIAGSLKKHPGFAGADDNELIRLAERCRLAWFAPDEIVVRKGGVEREIPLLLEGRCVVFGETKEGWNNPLRILREGSILDYSPLFSGDRTFNTIACIESSVVLFIPCDDLMVFLSANPLGMMEIMRLLEKDKRTFMKLWMGAE